MRAFEVASQQPWLIRAEMLDTILDICSRDNVITAEVIDKVEARRESVAAQRGRRMDDTRYTTRRGPVAVIDVNGPIVRYADFFTEVSGGTSTENLATDFRAALDDPSVKAIILDINSPGGEATGINELANMIFEARGTKPIVAYAEGYAASAAYWIASAADEIVADATAMLGSIGTVFSVPDPTQTKSRRIEIVSTQSPKKRPDATTDTGRSQLQRWADELTTVFIDAVARNRGITADAVLQEFGQGDMRIGDDAVKHGMADRLGSLESLIAELSRPQGAAAQTHKSNGGNMKEPKTTPAPEAETAVESPEMLALRRENEKLRAESEANRKVAADALTEKAKAEAKAQVDVWQREGKITGNSEKEVRAFYTALATGETVTPAQFVALMAAMPPIDRTRVAEDVKPPSTHTGDVSLDDFTKSGSDAAASKRISAAVTERKKSDPKFTAAKLERELRGTAAR